MRLKCALLLLLAFPAPAFGAGGFGEPVAVGSGAVAVSRTIAPVAARGGDVAALAWADGNWRVHVARRAGAGAWQAQTLSPVTDELQDLQLVVAPGGGAVAAWTETNYDDPVKGGVPDWFRVAVARPGRPFGRPQVIAKGPRADSALPRLAALTDGRVVLVWRAAREPRGGELRMAFLAGGRFGRSTRLGFDGIFPAVAAASDGSAVVSWASKGRHLFAARLAAGRHRLARPFELDAAAAAGARLAADSDGVVIASWGTRGARRGLVAAQVAPSRGPLFSVVRGRPEATGPAIALGAGGGLLTTFLAPTQMERPPGTPWPGQWAASGTITGGIGARVEASTASGRPLAAATPAILPDGEQLLVWADQSHTVLVARRPAGAAAFDEPEALATGHPRSRPLPLPVALAQAGDHMLVAWPGPRGGLAVAERLSSR